MTLLDAYALIAFLTGGPAASDVRSILRDREARVTAANLAEALDVSERVRGLPIHRAAQVLEPLFGEALAVVAVEFSLARRAAEILSRHYHRSTRPISLADAVLIAAAGQGDRIAAADPDVLAVAAAEGIDTVPLPAQG